MNNQISIDVTDAKECAVPEDKFRIVHFNIGNVKVEDLVYKGPPFFHFQVLRPENEEQREKALAYFEEHHKIYTAFINSPEILLFIGSTENIYIKSLSVEFEPDELMNILPQAAHWFRFHMDEKSEVFTEENEKLTDD